MVRVAADKRSITAREEPEAEARLRETVVALRDAQFQAARDLAIVDASAAFVLAGCASIGEYAASLGYDPLEGRDLANLGKAMAMAPEFEGEVRSGDIPFRMACAVGRVLGNPRYHREGDDWLSAARNCSWTDLQKRIRARIAEVEQEAAGVTEVSVFVRPRVKDDFEQCRQIASQKAGKTLTQDQAFVRVVDHYLDSFDPARRKSHGKSHGRSHGKSHGSAGGAGTNGATPPDSRYVSASVRREIRRRSGARCEFPGCRCRMRLQYAHVIPKWKGGGQEAGNLFLLCPLHHLLFDAGLIRWIDGPIGDPVFGIASTGEKVRRGRPRAPPTDRVEEGLPRILPTRGFALIEPPTLPRVLGARRARRYRPPRNRTPCGRSSIG